MDVIIRGGRGGVLRNMLRKSRADGAADSDHLHAFRDGLDVLFGLEPEHRYGRGPGVGGGRRGRRRGQRGRRRWRRDGDLLRRRRRRLGGGRAVHDGRRQVAGVAGLRMGQEPGQRGQ